MNLLGRALDKNFWESVRKKECFSSHREELMGYWNEICEAGPLTALRYSDFKLFWTTGNRDIYEKEYFFRRKALITSSLLALIYPEEEKYINEAMDVIYAICDEYTWCLPAHQGSLEINNNTVIDLFASETGFALSEAYTILEERLDPLIKNRIRAEIERRIITPFVYENRNYWWCGGDGNWTAVCVGSIACTLMLLFPDLFDSQKDRILNSMDSYLGSFADDGVCLEGCLYWHYGFGFFTVFADMVKKFTDGEIDYFSREHVKNIASFLQKMFLTDGIGVSFSDGFMDLAYHTGTLHYLKSLYPNDVSVFAHEYSYNCDDCNRFSLYLRSFIWFSEEYYYSPDPGNSKLDFYAENAQWLIKRTSSYGFAAKGGNNAEAHNNNDVGTFIFAKNGRQLFQDIGRGVYSKQYFDNSVRYNILEASSRGHSVPIINGQYQSFGREFRAENVKYEKDPLNGVLSNNVFSMDIAPAYGISSVRKINRAFGFTEDTVTLRDEFVIENNENVDITERFVTLIKPDVMSCGKVCVGDAVMTFDPTSVSLSIGNEVRERGDICYFIDFKLKNNVREFTVEIK